MFLLLLCRKVPTLFPHNQILVAVWYRAFEIYAIRWTTEIFFKEAKQYLGLGKCQSVDFDAQTASTSIVMLEYSLLSLAKKELEYQTIGGILKRYAYLRWTYITYYQRISSWFSRDSWDTFWRTNNKNNIWK